MTTSSRPITPPTVPPAIAPTLELPPPPEEVCVEVGPVDVEVGGKVDVIVICEPEFVIVGMNTNKPEVVGGGRGETVGTEDVVLVVCHELSGESAIITKLCARLQER